MYGGGQEATARYEAWASDAMTTISSAASGAYVNFLAKEGEAGLRAAYPPATLARLRKIKRVYDPENLFRLNQNIVP